MPIETKFKSKFILMLTIIITTFLSLNFLDFEVIAQIDTYTTYANFGFTVKYPSSWTVGENIGDTFDEVYIRSSAEDMTAPNLMIIRSHNETYSNMSFDEYTNVSISNYSDEKGRVLELNKDNYFLGGVKAIRGIAILNSSENIEVKALFYETLYDEKRFGIFASAKVDQFDEYEPIFKRIIESFKFTDQVDSNTTNITGKGSYSNFGFIVQHPVTWTVEQIVGNKTFEEFYLESSPKDATSPSVIISRNIDRMFSNMSFDEYSKWNLDTLTNSNRYSTGFQPIEVNSDDYFLGGIKAIRSITLANIESIEVKGLSYQTIKDGLNFRIHASAKVDQFDEYEPIFKRIIESFKFIDPTTTNTIENQNSKFTITKDQEIQKRSDVKSLQDDFVVLVILKPLKDSIDNKSIEVEKQKSLKELQEKPKVIKRVSVDVFLDTHIYTVFDQDVSVRLYNSNGQIDGQYLTVPDTGGIILPFNVDESNIPEGTLFTVCVTNQGNFKEDCQTVNRGYGDDNINVRMTVP